MARARLRSAGIEVAEGLLAAEAARQNAAFIRWISSSMPLVSLKTAMSLDGKVAARSGHSQWITGGKRRAWRCIVCAIVMMRFLSALERCWRMTHN